MLPSFLPTFNPTLSNINLSPSLSISTSLYLSLFSLPPSMTHSFFLSHPLPLRYLFYLTLSMCLLSSLSLLCLAHPLSLSFFLSHPFSLFLSLSLSLSLSLPPPFRDNILVTQSAARALGSLAFKDEGKYYTNTSSYVPYLYKLNMFTSSFLFCLFHPLHISSLVFIIFLRLISSFLCLLKYHLSPRLSSLSLLPLSSSPLLSFVSSPSLLFFSLVCLFFSLSLLPFLSPSLFSLSSLLSISPDDILFPSLYICSSVSSHLLSLLCF